MKSYYGQLIPMNGKRQCETMWCAFNANLVKMYNYEYVFLPCLFQYSVLKSLQVPFSLFARISSVLAIFLPIYNKKSNPTLV